MEFKPIKKFFLTPYNFSSLIKILFCVNVNGINIQFRIKKVYNVLLFFNRINFKSNIHKKALFK